jgi:hypothetical protein
MNRKELVDFINAIKDLRVNLSRVNVGWICCNEYRGGGESFVKLLEDETTTNPIFHDQVLTFLGLDLDDPVYNAEVTSTKDLSDVISRLDYGELEKTVQTELAQKWFTAAYDNCYAIDLSSVNPSFPIFKFSPEVSKGFSRSAKTNYFSSVMPMFLDIKSKGKERGNEYLVIKQAIEHVTVTARINEMLKLIVAFATIGKSSWIVILKRNYSTPASEVNPQIVFENYYCYPISSTAIFPLWHMINAKAVGNPAYYLHESGVKLSAVLFSLGIHPGFCMLKMKCISDSSNIISVTPGIGKTMRDFAIPQNRDPRIGFTVKLSANRELSRGRNEVKCLQKLKGHTAVQHVIATMVIQSNQVSSITWFSGRKIQKLNHLPSDFSFTTAPADSSFGRFSNTMFDVPLKTGANLGIAPKCEGFQKWSWWNFPTKNQITDFTAVVTCKGHRIVSPSSEILPQLNKLLGEIHENGVFHCDLRAPNILYFEVGDVSDDETTSSDTTKIYRFIDFDLAAIVADDDECAIVQLDLQGKGARYHMIVEDLNMTHKIDPLRRIKWTAELDFSFLAATMKLKSSQRNIPGGGVLGFGENRFFS